VGKDRVGKKVGGNFNKLGMGKGSAEVIVGQVVTTNLTLIVILVEVGLLFKCPL
jgi:hypothetical protein